MANLTINPAEQIGALVSDANALAARIKAANSDPSEAVKAVLASSDDKRVVEYREKRGKAEAQIEKLQSFLTELEESVQDIALSLLPTASDDFDVEAATKEFLAKRAEVTALKKAIGTIVGTEALEAALKDAGVSEVVSLRGTRSGVGSSSPRPRISSATVNGEKVADEKGNVTFGSLTAYLSEVSESKVDADYVKGAALSAAGTRDFGSLSPETEVSFGLKIGEKDYAIVVTPRAKKAAKSEENSEQASE